VEVHEVDDDIFAEIPRRVPAVQQTPTEPGCIEYLRDRCRAHRGGLLHACYPIDIFRLVKSTSEYEGKPVRITRANIDRAVAPAPQSLKTRTFVFR
jgi:hypothetical protein